MAADAYFKAAASNLRQAAQAKKAEADEARRRMAQEEQNKKSQLDDVKNLERTRQTQVNHVESDTERARVSHEVIELHSKANEIERNIAQTKEQLQREAAMKEQQAADITRQAAGLERMS
jgi:hypothetical protein